MGLCLCGGMRDRGPIKSIILLLIKKPQHHKGVIVPVSHTSAPPSSKQLWKFSREPELHKHGLKECEEGNSTKQGMNQKQKWNIDTGTALPTRTHSNGDTENSSTLGDKVGILFNERRLKQREP